MTNYRNHFLLGLLVGGFFIFLMNKFFNWFSFSFLNILLYILIIFLFSLLPDIDHKISKITWIFLGFGIIGLIYGVFFDYTVLIISIIFITLTFCCATWFGHRGIIHGLIAGSIFALPLYFYFGLPEFLLSLVAFQSHIWGDRYFFRLW